MRRLVPAVLALAVAVLVGGAARAQITLVPGPPTLVARAPQFIAAADPTCPASCRRGTCSVGGAVCSKSEDCGPNGPCTFRGTCAIGGGFCTIDTDCGTNGPCEHVCDFNRDGFADAVVTNSGSNKVTVLFGSADGSFSSAIDLTVGRRLNGIAAADLNSDCLTDIAEATGFQNLVYKIPGNGDGSFRKPIGFPVSKSSKDVAVGDFDNKNGNDMVAVSESTDTVSVLVNAGGNGGFNQGGDFQVGNRPKRVDVADFNGDGFDDIASLNTGTSAADDVSILLNTGTGATCCSFGFPSQFVVGINAVDMTVGDFNNDGAPDLLVLNAGQGTVANSLSVSVLLNVKACRTGPKQGATCSADADCGSGGTCKPTGRFNTAVPVALNCPTSIGGIPISCRAQNIAAADFNIDGFVDFVVSFETLAQASSTITPGLLSAFAGRGDGSFDFATQVSVGFRPEGLVAADFTGDGIPDIGVAEFGSRTVRIVAAIGPAPLPPGALCNVSAQCASHSCIDGVCCDVQPPRSCPTGQFCNIPGSVGECHAPLPNGELCTEGQQCASQSCVDGFCCGGNLPAGTTTCPAPAGQSRFCNTGVCAPPSGQGTQCNDDQQCQSPFSCTDFTCCELSECPAGDLCNIPGNLGFCTAPGPQGNPCANSQQCQTGLFCVDDTCCVTDTGMASCQAGESCGLPDSLGLCQLIPTATPTLTPTPTSTPTTTPSFTLTPTVTPTPQQNGATCASGTQCVSQACADGVCCNLPPGSTQCPNVGESCKITGSFGTCAPQQNTGHECGGDADCLSANCDNSTNPPHCAATKTPTPTATKTHTPTATFTSTPTPFASGSQCDSAVQCTSESCVDGFCCDLPAGSTICPNHPQSGQPQFCDIPLHEGACATPRPEPGLGTCDPTNADACDPGWVCNPDNLVCCDSESCPDGERCDIFSSPGTCAPQLLPEDQCEKNTDCAAPLICQLDPPPSNLSHCRAAPTPLPTLIPTQAPTPTFGVQVSVSRGGGCSINHDADGSGLWLLGGLPFLLWVRRYALDRVRSRD